MDVKLLRKYTHFDSLFVVYVKRMLPQCSIV